MEYERSEATVKLALPGGGYMHEVAEGNGPVAALDAALRKALEPTYPNLQDLHLTDYKVRVVRLPEGGAAGAEGGGAAPLHTVIAGALPPPSGCWWRRSLGSGEPSRRLSHRHRLRHPSHHRLARPRDRRDLLHRRRGHQHHRGVLARAGARRARREPARGAATPDAPRPRHARRWTRLSTSSRATTRSGRSSRGTSQRRSRRATSRRALPRTGKPAAPCSDRRTPATPPRRAPSRSHRRPPSRRGSSSNREPRLSAIDPAPPPLLPMRLQ